MSYQLVSGLETHVELATSTKIFCGCTTAFGGAPNTHCCPVCTGQPGALPVLNKKVVEYAIRAGLALNCKINAITHLDRKNYCYPDLPKAYQISQHDKPLCHDGFIELDSGKKIRIERIHIEEDAGKLVHDKGVTLIDYNRGGVPLIEIVTKPDISSPEEAREYLEKLQLTMRYIGVSECRMQEGGMRCDVNISIREEGSSALNERTEIKNMNSLNFIERAMRYEFERQKDVVSGGGKVRQATLRFDEATGETYVMRVKENAWDYRYFPEPDILTVEIPREMIDGVAKTLPELPDEKLKRYLSFDVNGHNARLVTRYKRVCDFIDGAIALGASPKNCINFTAGVIFASLPTEESKERFQIAVTCADFAKLIKLTDGGKLNVTLAQSILSKALSGENLDALIPRDGGVDAQKLMQICKEAIAANPQAVADYKSGKQKAISALFGYIKRATQGRADIREAEALLKSLIG